MNWDRVHRAVGIMVAWGRERVALEGITDRANSRVTRIRSRFVLKVVKRTVLADSFGVWPRIPSPALIVSLVRCSCRHLSLQRPTIEESMSDHRAETRIIKTQYHVRISRVAWHRPDALCNAKRQTARHRTPAAALRANDVPQRRCRSIHGPNTFVRTKVLATDDGGETYRSLTAKE